MNPNETLVREFLAVWHERDIDKIVEYFAADALYHNVPIDPWVGRDHIRENLVRIVPLAELLDFELVKVFSDGDRVVAERIDHIVRRGVRADLPVVGMFDVRDGKVQSWRDYCDPSVLAPLRQAMADGGFKP